MRSALKRIFESAVLWTGLATVVRSRHGGRLLVLAYHNVVDDEHTGLGESSLHIPVSLFRAQLDALEQLVDVISLDEFLSSDGPAGSVLQDHHTPARGTKRPRVAITFDDAYRGAVSVGLPELAVRSMPATIFVSPGRLGGHGFWWDRYASHAAAGGYEDFREMVLTRFEGRDEQVAEWAGGVGLAKGALPDQLQVASESELAEAAEAKGVTLACHGWSHVNLTRVNETTLNEELSRPLEWLVSRFPAVKPWLAYPYGCTDARVACAAANAGYEAAFRIDGGWMPEEPGERMLLPRLNVPAGLSVPGFRLRLSGLLCGG